MFMSLSKAKFTLISCKLGMIDPCAFWLSDLKWPREWNISMSLNCELIEVTMPCEVVLQTHARWQQVGCPSIGKMSGLIRQLAFWLHTACSSGIRSPWESRPGAPTNSICPKFPCSCENDRGGVTTTNHQTLLCMVHSLTSRGLD